MLMVIKDCTLANPEDRTEAPAKFKLGDVIDEKTIKPWALARLRHHSFICDGTEEDRQAILAGNPPASGQKGDGDEMGEAGTETAPEDPNDGEGDGEGNDKDKGSKEDDMEAAAASLAKSKRGK